MLLRQSQLLTNIVIQKILYKLPYSFLSFSIPITANITSSIINLSYLKTPLLLSTLVLLTNIIWKQYKRMNSQERRPERLTELAEVDIGEQIKKTIQSVSKNDRFQKRILVLFIVIAFFTRMQMHSTNFFYMNPVFKCEGIDGKATEEDACATPNFCTIMNQGTITADLELYCDSRKDSRTLLQTTASFGNLLGLLLVGWFSDRKGRKVCFCIGILILNLTCIGQIVGVQSNNIPLLMVAEFIAGVSDKMVYLSFLVILTRFLRKEGYEIGTLAWLIVSNGISQMVIAGLIEVFSSWKIIVYIYSIGVLACSIASIFVLKEDPVFLFDTGKLKESKEIIEEIGIMNGEDFNTNQQNLKQLDRAFEIKMLKIQNRLFGINKFSLSQIMRCDIFQVVLIVGLAGCCYNLASRSIDLSIQSLKFGYNFNLFVVGLSNSCGFLTAMYVIKIEPQRKRGLIYTSLLYGVIAMLFLFSFCTENGNVETAVIFALRFFLCWSCNFYTRLKVDSFPEKYQMTLIGFIEVFVAIGNIVAPTLIQQSVDRNISPIVFINFLRIILGTLPVFMLMESRIQLIQQPSEPGAKGRKDIQT